LKPTVKAGLAALAAMLVLALPTVASAATSHSIHVTGKVAVVTVSGTRNTAVGLFSGSPFGANTVAVIRTKVVGSQFRSTLLVINASGTITGTSVQTTSAGPNGSTLFKGSGKVTGGTRKYAGATGKISFSGTEPKDATVVSYTVTGTIKY
jgi:hypothetical protein